MKPNHQGFVICMTIWSKHDQQTATDITTTLSVILQRVTEEIAECLCVRVTVKLFPLRFLGKIASLLGVIAERAYSQYLLPFSSGVLRRSPEASLWK